MNKQSILLLFSALLLMLMGQACKQEGGGNVNQTNQDVSVNIADSLTNMGNEQWRMGNYQEALTHFNKAYIQVKKTGNKQQMATLLNNLGLVHWRLENNTAAMECYNEAAQLAEKLNLKRLLGLTHTNRALILKEQRNFKAAFEHNNKAISLFKELKEPRDLAIAYNNQGQIYRYGDSYDDALLYYKLSLEECRKINYEEGMATAYQNMGTVYTQQGDKAKAYENARRCLNLSLNLNSKVRISEAYLELSKIHDKFSRPDSALYYYKKHYEWEKDLMEANQSDLLSRHQANMGMEVKNLRIQNLQNEKEIAGNRLWIIGSGVLIALLIAGFIIYRYLSNLRFRKQQLELELKNSQRLIEVKEQELKTYIVDLSKKNAIINSLQTEPEKIVVSEPYEQDVAQLLDQKILTDDDWDNFKGRFNNIYPNFFKRIKASKIILTEAETRILVLMRLELNGKDMANILGISPQSVRVCKMRLKKKLSAENFDTVEEFLKKIIQ